MPKNFLLKPDIHFGTAVLGALIAELLSYVVEAKQADGKPYKAMIGSAYARRSVRIDDVRPADQSISVP